MKYALIAAMVLATVPAVAQQAAPAPTLVAGSEVKIESLIEAKWVQGDPLKAFEPGKIYMFECWATWCGPCIASIPHINELHKKFYDKGLRLYGMSIWEDDYAKVENFVKAKGEGMSYPVAFTGRGSSFEINWLKPAGVNSVPCALIVKDGKLVLRSRFLNVTDDLIEALLAGGETSQKAITEFENGEKTAEKIMALIREFSLASQKSDAAAMEKILVEIEKTDPNMMQLPMMKIDILMVRKEFAAAIKMLEELPDPQQRQMTSSMMAGKIASEKDSDAYPVDFVKTIVKDQEKISALQNPVGLVTLSNLQWRVGDKEAALKSANSAVTAVKDPTARKFPVAPFEKFAKSVEDGTMPAMAEFSQWMTAELKAAHLAKQAAPATPVAPAAPAVK
ncbi:MAG: TlpA disulfide reductase family protein [Verrucomicrobiota bacterium]